VTSVVVVGVVAAALALWQLRLLVALLLLGFTIAAAMRPGVDRLAGRGVPRSVGVLLHFAGLVVAIGLLLWLAVPPAVHQLSAAVGDQSGLRDATRHSTGIKHEFLLGLQKRLERLPSGAGLIHPAVTVTTKARDRAEQLVLELVPRRRRLLVRETWNLIDLKLGAFVRGQLLMIAFVSTVLSAAFALIGLPYWLLLGCFAGLFEIVPVIGPLAAGTAAVLVGLTIDWQHALAAAIAVFGLRLLQDYLINPHVFGHAVGLSPLVVLVTVSSVGLLFGGVFVLLAVPLASVLGTLVDVFARHRDPAREDVPTVIFPAKDSEA
jgi:predicted PurR-regulated permease PerM